jgi:5-methylcytosine-specific restriction endonuclease McrA
MTYSTLKRGGPLRQRSKKREQEDRDFEPLRKACFERDGKCMAPLEWGVCEGRWHAHHVISRARDHTLVLVLENLRTLCFRHHQYAHDHPAEASLHGLMASSPVFPNPPQKTPKEIS